MKRLFMLLCAVVAFAACEQAPIKEVQGAAINERNLEVSFEGGDDTRIQLQNGKTVWTKGDHVSVFYRSTVNEEWQFMGETGDRIGNIVPVDNTLNPPVTHNRVVVIYPYNNEYYLNTETYSIEASLPAVQNYLEDSYGTNGNIMVSSGDYKQVSLKSVCGWLKLQLTGDGEVVKSITLRGNNGEQVAGELHINTSDATCVLASTSGDAGESEVGGTLVRPGAILTEVTLDCGEGVALGEESTAFYIALPPQTFEKGFTVDIECDNYKPMTLSTTNTLTIKRNHIQPMAAKEYAPSVPNNQIWYTSSYGNIVEPYNTNAFGATIISNEYNNGKGVIIFDGDVTSIGERAFEGCDSLTSVNIPDSVTSIGNQAFVICDSLTSVNIPDSVTTIENDAFSYCTSLTEFTGKFATEDGRSLIVDNTIIAYANASGNTYNIPDSVTTIGKFAFCGCDSLTSVNIPDSVTSIGYEAFSDCRSLTSVNIGDSVTTIGNSAFYDCRSLTRVNIPDRVTWIGNYAFCGCSSLTSVNIPDSLTTIGAGAFSSCDSLTNVTIPDSVTTIEEYAFSGCDSLTSVNIPDSVTTIGSNAFAYCDSLTSVNIPDSVTTIGGGAFAYCDSLTSVNIPDSVTTIGNYAFYYCESLTSVNIPDSVTTIGGFAFAYCDSLTSVNIPDSVTEIEMCAFHSCTSLTSVNIPDSVTTIGNDAFNLCYSLTSVNIGDSVTTIGNYAFAECDSLTSVNIPDSVTTIGEGAFYECDSLTSVNIPDSVTTIGNSAFYECNRLTSVYCKATTPPALVDSDVFDYNGSGRKIYVPTESVDAYKSATNWSEYASAIVGYDFENGVVVDIPNNEIWYTATDKVTPNNSDAFNVTIQSHEWNSTTGIGVITFDGEVTAIDNDAFYYCDDLTSVTIPKSVSKIGYTAFYRCYNLQSVYCTSITPPTAALDYYEEWYAFDSNASDRKIYVPYESVDAYRSADGWSEYASAIVGYNF